MHYLPTIAVKYMPFLDLHGFIMTDNTLTESMSTHLVGILSGFGQAKKCFGNAHFGILSVLSVDF
jgi:hypothetical protein